MRLLLVGLLALLTGACDGSQASIPAPASPPDLQEKGWTAVTFHEGWWGFTHCGNEPTSWLNISGDVPPELEGEVRAHELKHLEQFRRYTSCREFRAAQLSDSELAIRHEAEAWCAGARWRYENGFHPSLLLAVLAAADRFSWYFTWRGDVDTAAKWILHYCQE